MQESNENGIERINMKEDARYFDRPQEQRLDWLGVRVKGSREGCTEELLSLTRV